MEEEKKKRMEQKILQNDEKVRGQAKLWAARYGDYLSELWTTRVQTGPWHNMCRHRAAAGD